MGCRVGKRGNSVRLSRNHFDVFAYFHAVFQFAKFRCRRRSVHSGAKIYKGFKIFIKLSSWKPGLEKLKKNIQKPKL